MGTPTLGYHVYVLKINERMNVRANCDQTKREAVGGGRKIKDLKYFHSQFHYNEWYRGQKGLKAKLISL